MVRRMALAFTLLAVMFAAKAHQAAQAAERLDAETIKWALKVSEEENNGFVERVVTLMNQRRLSRASVTIAFAKARKRVKHKFQYFKHAMIELAAQQGVSLAQPHRCNRPTVEKTWWQRVFARVRRLARV